MSFLLVACAVGTGRYLSPFGIKLWLVLVWQGDCGDSDSHTVLHQYCRARLVPQQGA